MGLKFRIIAESIFLDIIVSICVVFVTNVENRETSEASNSIKSQAMHLKLGTQQKIILGLKD